MNRRLGFVWRLALIVVTALVVAQLAGVAAYLAEHRAASRFGIGSLLPDQIVAVVRLADSLPLTDRARLATAVGGPGVHLEFRDAFDPASAPGRESALLERAVRLRLAEDGGRTIHAAFTPRDPSRDDAAAYAPGLRVVVALKSGGFLDFEAVGDLTTRLFGIPVGFLAGFFGLVVALLAIVAIARETRPLIRLAQVVDTFGTDLRPRPLAETGAPEVRHLVQAMNRMQARIVALVENRTLILGAIAHDLGTLLTRLRLRLELLPEDPARDRAVKDVREISQLLADSLTFARATADRDRTPLDLARFVAEFQADRAGLGQAVVMTQTLASAPIVGSRLGLTRLLDNLVDNALRHGGDAELGLTTWDGGPALTISDHGSGIPVADRARIFDPFVRLDPSRNRGSGGTGLGLTIARQIVEDHGGTIVVEDRADGVAGTRFVVRLPGA